MTDMVQTDKAHPEGQSFLTVHVGGERLALPAGDVSGVIRPPGLTRVPLGPESLLGLANLRGAVMPVVSLRALLGMEQSQPANARVIVVDRSSPVGLMIDAVGSFGGSDTTDVQRIDLQELLARDFGKFVRRSHQALPRFDQDDQAETAAREEITLLSFEIGGQDFALPLDSIVAVTALAADIAAVPHTEEVMLGVMTFHGRLLPLISLQGLLGLSGAGSKAAKARVVVTRIGEATVGLVVDGMKEILRVEPGAIDPVPPVLTRGAGEAEIQGICRLERGSRLVSVLSTGRLLRDQAFLEEASFDSDDSQDMDMAAMHSTDEEQFIVFQLGGEDYGLPIGAVDEVVRLPETLSRLPKAPAFIEGVMNLRGRVVPIIDQRRRFKLEASGENRQERAIVVTIGDMQAGFIVDRVVEILAVPVSRLRPTTEFVSESVQVIDRVANLEEEGRMILLLDPRELLDSAERDLLATMSDGSEVRAPS
jgi:purine-binding chemotaxis protein CheW